MDSDDEGDPGHARLRGIERAVEERQASRQRDDLDRLHEPVAALEAVWVRLGGDTGAPLRAWALTGVELYLNATDGCGWSDADYERLLSALLQEQLLDHRPRAAAA